MHKKSQRSVDSVFTCLDIEYISINIESKSFEFETKNKKDKPTCAQYLNLLSDILASYKH